MIIDVQNYQPITAFPTSIGIPYSQAIDMKIKDLSLIECSVEANLTVRDIAKLFEVHPNWPAVVIVSNGHFLGMLSRHQCFEVLGKPFGLEVFSRKTIIEFYESFNNHFLIIDSETSIQEAAKTALSREKSQIFEPVVVRLVAEDMRILNIHVLLLAQSDVLENLYDEFHQLSTIDQLTQLNNRRGFFESAQSEIIQTNINHNDLTALMIDIDNFKKINDSYGHFIGDQVLRAVATEIQKALRQTDLIGRYGGEEFIALLPNTPTEVAFSVAERLREAVENLVVEIHEIQVSVTISIGICHINDTDGSLDALLSQADQSMYQAKSSGRNCIHIWNQACSQSTAMKVIRKELRIKSRKSDQHVDISIIEKAYDETIEGWSKAIELKDKELHGHAQRVVELTMDLARKCGVNEIELTNIRRGALLHDIGKIAVPDLILCKPGKLSEEEWVVMRKHPVYAYEFLSPITFLQNCLDIPYCHHEHWDGSGYPRGLKGDQIPLAARIFTIIDVWDALCSDRCYRPAWSQDEARQYILSQSGKMFDPDIVAQFIQLLDENIASSTPSISKSLMVINQK